MINKRYRDIFQQYIHRGEPTPLNLGTLAVCALCFLILMVSTFTQFVFQHPWIDKDFSIVMKNITYTPQIPAMIFIIYILGKPFSILTMIAYILVGFFLWPIFVLGGGIDYVQNYLFGYLVGFIFATLIAGTILKKGQSILYRLLASLAGVFTIHITAFVYCLILAMLQVIDPGMIIPIINVISGSKIGYDILFSCLIIIIAPWIKNVLWICMKPKPDLKRRLKYSGKRD